MFVYIDSVNPPAHLKYEIKGFLVELQWSRPNYTGRIPITLIYYNVTINEDSATVSDDSEVVRYTIPEGVYGDVVVRTINACGQESHPISLIIPAAGIHALVMV